MILLLAESKTMSSDQMVINETTLEANLPKLEDTADQIMTHVADLSPMQISSILGISSQLAVKAHSLAYDFSFKKTGYKAIWGFIGEAFRAFDVKSISNEALDRAESSLRIISSVYGILKPSDIIKPYRCEFNKAIAPDQKKPIQIFKSKVTIELVNYIKEKGIKEVLNLLPGDADKCIDWKIIKAFATVNKISFMKIDQTGQLKTPIAGQLKELRGLMARIVLSQNIQSIEELKRVISDRFLFSPHDSKPGLPVFITT